ncbi:MAG: cyclic pyranopterin monophosphate synthase MoaC [Negativicutes bacterium]|nr:cyclic pyranopterin monophosphate synthase MoaC [Negativicutes bacterium]
MSVLTHINSQGQACMVDVTGKTPTVRTACASATVQLTEKTARAIEDDQVAKGDVLAAARIAGIMAAKQTSRLIPLCHDIPLGLVQIDFRLCHRRNQLRIFTYARTTAATGVEMEALSAASVAALTVYDMCKGMDKGIWVRNIRLDGKTGGKSGYWLRPGGGVGVVKAVCRSERKHVAKQEVERAELRPDWGMVGDAHAGEQAGDRQLSLLAIESYRRQFPDRQLPPFGTFAENLTTEGLDLPTLPLGARLLVGSCEVEVSKIGKICHHRCAIYQQSGDCVMPREGIFVRVLNGGTVAAGDLIRVVSELESSV